MAEIPKDYKKMTREEMMALSGAERVMIACQMSQDYRQEILASFPSGLSEIETKRRPCERLYGDEVDIEGFVQYLQKKEKEVQEENNNDF